MNYSTLTEERVAKIYKPAKSAMQSGYRNSKKWILEFVPEVKYIENLMGWVGSADTLTQFRLPFSTREEAIEYAKSKNIKYIVIEEQNRIVNAKSYSDNFIKKKP